MPRECDCAGGCGPKPDGVTRRDFITLVGAGAAGAMLPGAAWAEMAQAPPDELARWQADLRKPDKPRRYRSDIHRDARMHLGGIGTGNVEIGADGQFTTWQLFNTLRDGHVPLYFGVRAGGVARLLQTAGGPDLPRVKAIEMTGEYPFATLRYLDDDLPVRVEMDAFSPFAPLDTRLSSMPLACMVFRIHNPTRKRQEVSLMGMMTNPIGYDAAGEIVGVRHPNFGGNENGSTSEGVPNGAALYMRARAGNRPTLDRPVRILTNINVRALNTPPADRPLTLTVEGLDRLPPAPSPPDGKGEADDPATIRPSIIWLEDVPADLPAAVLRAARAAVEKGATLVFSGRAMPLLAAYAEATEGKPLEKAGLRPGIVFEDFEGGYGKWTVEGKAFGEKPAAGTLPNQQPVTGFQGKGLVNTFLGGDDATGKLVSQAFTVERRFIRLLAGGGRQATTQVRLVVDGRPVRTASGRDEERLLPVIWDVREFTGKQARIEIVDEQQGPWGHINVDNIEFTDLPADPETLELLDALLPARFRAVRPAENPPPGVPPVVLEGLTPQPGSMEQQFGEGPQYLSQPLGSGKVFLALGPILDPAQAGLWGARQKAYQQLCMMVGADYRDPQSVPSDQPGYGALALAVMGGQPSALNAFEEWNTVWQTFAGGAPLGDSLRMGMVGSPPGVTVNGALATTVTVEPGKTLEVPFLLAWRYPNKYNGAGVWMGCHYAETWPDVQDVVREAATNFPALREKTERFHRAFYDSTLPYWLLDCVTANMSILRHIGIVFRIANGDTYGWEGSNGCCQPTCTHVWGYEQTLSRCFPELERDMRRLDFKHQQRTDGGVHNRMEVPSPPRPTSEGPFADGHASCILKAYREALNAPDDGFLKEYWPHIQKAVEYLIGRDAATSGGEPNGVLEDDQWNTYDEALHGVTTFISGYYLAALRAGEEWAKRAGDDAAAQRFHAVFEKGQKRLIDLCWDGEYFRQHLPGYETMPGEVGPGCMSDQMIGQWWAHQLGLGYLFPKEMVVSALKSVYKYNFKTDLTGWPHSPRAFAGAKDKGLIIVTWPKGGRPPHVMLYSDEVWTGIEYQAAAHMLYEGLTDEAFAIVKGARDRYDGVPRAPIPRNPWNEIECGGHYARAMSSWSLLLALSGWEYDGPAQRLAFTPRHAPGDFRAFFCGPEGWGRLRQTRRGRTQRSEIRVDEGWLAVATLRLDSPGEKPRVRATVGRRTVTATAQPVEGGVLLAFTEPVVLQKGETLSVSLG